MPYILLEKGHTISADDFNNNYYHVGQGHLTPKSGTLLEETTGLYDLGSNAYRWNDVHIQNIELQSGGEIPKCMHIIAEVTLTATASSIEFTGLNGETDKIYEIICNLKGYATGSTALIFNSDSATNYGYQLIYVLGTTITAARNNASNIFLGWLFLNTTTGQYIKNHIICYANNNIKLILQKDADSIGDTYIRAQHIYGQVWNNSETLTSMKFNGHFSPNTHIEIWAKR